MTRAFADTTQRLAWHPVSAVAGTGNYVTIWRRQGDGSWTVAVDIGNADPAAVPPAKP